jgi:hypothetical protein
MNETLPTTIEGIVAVNFDVHMTVEEMRAWSAARIELFFLGLTLSKAAATNSRLEYSEEKIKRLVETLP